MVEHAAVNRRVVGSSPTRGATKKGSTCNLVLPFFVEQKSACPGYAEEMQQSGRLLSGNVGMVVRALF